MVAPSFPTSSVPCTARRPAKSLRSARSCALLDIVESGRRPRFATSQPDPAAIRATPPLTEPGAVAGMQRLIHGGAGLPYLQ